MPSFTAWYSQQYASWNRTRRLRASPYLATTESNASRRATALATGTTNAPSTANDVEANLSEPPKSKKQETLFGPNIGIVSDGPAWAQSQDVKRSTSSDYLTPETVKRWMEMSNEVLSIQPTTTLQALVNLKRPTLKLSPLQADDPPDDLTESHNNHALEFEYDCDAPKCCIKVQVIIPSKEPNSHGSSHPISERITVYESVFDGGFGRLLKLEDGATIDLGQFEHPGAHGGRLVGVDRLSPNLDKITEQLEVPSQSNTPLPDQQDNVRKRRFTGIYFRRRSQNVSGPALAVVDDAAAATESGEKERDVLDDDGVRVAIQLVALDDFGKELSPVNRQSTYLHVVRLGPPVTSEDNRSWVVKVVKREAMIGPHAFHLHEIYGLSSSAQLTLSVINHTYPPTVNPVDDEPSSECLVCLSSPREVVLLPCRHLVACKECAINMIEFGAGGAIMHTEEPATTTEPQPAETAETPRISGAAPPAVVTGPAGEDVAAPVAVSESEVGNADSSAVDPSQVAVQPTRDEEPVAPSAPAPQAGPTTGAQPTPTGPQNAPPQQNPRRKRRPKGWSCPVCRQPYTSLLRITTAPPTINGGKEGKRVSTSTIDHPLAVPPVSVPAQTVTPALETTLEEPTAPAPAPPSRSLRPAFLRALSRRPADPVSPV